ncbi:hypothetical protein B296_00003960 [Ensete ventricosum]|uniref:Uncharacterized protein n=1 Tax=Ensete ventricosum TaxID=4639 RepID=A0A427B5G6_ENSVE|nr:hypothetical protein B296_00003960 [Ensete ventricosum]
MTQCCHSSCYKEKCITEIVLVGDRGLGSRQWCTNFSEVCGLRELLAMDCPRAMLCPGETQEWVGEAVRELDCPSAHIRLREPGKSEDKAECVEEGDRKGRGSDDESRGAQLPKSKALIRMEVDTEECHNVAKVDLLIVKKGT